MDKLAVNGVLIVNKPSGMTSAKVVAVVKRALGARRVGHTGTLDPMATGVLPICVGEATKIAGYLLSEDKFYDADILLGVETDTLDADGAVTRRDEAAANRVSLGDVQTQIAHLTGDIEQVPPMFSAVKHQGRRLHELARAGENVVRAARAVTVHAFEVVEFSAPRLSVRIHCSKGTYIRTLASDLGAALGCGAHVTRLERTRSGRFELCGALALDELSKDRAAAHLISLPAALEDLQQIPVPADELRHVANGLRVRWRNITEIEPESPCCLLTPGGDLLAIVQVCEGRIEYERVFTYGLTSDPTSFNLPATQTTKK